MEKKTIIKQDDVRALLEKLSEDYEVFVPVRNKENGLTNFADINTVKGNEDSVLDFNEKTKKSPKSLIFPQTEKIFGFEYIKDINKPDQTGLKIDDKSSETLKGKKRIIFGLKPCDTMGIKSFDLVFNDNGNEDFYYSERRSNTILISIGCNTIFPDCFCLAVGGDPFGFGYSDIGLVSQGDSLVLMKKSENKDVERLLLDNRKFFQEVDFDEDTLRSLDDTMASSVAEQEQILKDNDLKKIDKQNIEKLLENNFTREDEWKEISEKCISCGACTYVCPTCVCFNISDEIKELSGERYRCWDFCTNYYYTLEASGHNPRGKIFQRYRNKISCKFNYFHKRKNTFYCVGCGRCVDVCPVGMDIREILKRALAFKM